MKRATVGALLVVVIAIAAVTGVYAATTGDDDEPGTGGTPIGLSKCRAEDPNCLARLRGQDGDLDSSGGGAAAGSCLVGTNCEDTPETPTKPDDADIGATPPVSIGVCAPDTPDCVDTEVTTTPGGEE